MAKRVLIIDGHPDPDRARYGHALADAYLDGARSTGNEVRCINVAEAIFPILRTAAEFERKADCPAIEGAQQDLAWAQHVVLIFPLWLGGAPSLLRAFLEQVSRGQFLATTDAHGIHQKLKGRTARLIVTMGMPALVYRVLFHQHGVRNITEGILGLAGVKPVSVTLFGAIEACSHATASARLATVKALGREAR